MVLGLYVCVNCSTKLIDFYGGNKEVMIKDVLKEQWDDYQLRSCAFGGNKMFFDILKENDIGNSELKVRHKHPVVKWYRAKHIATIDDMPFHVAKPGLGAKGDKAAELKEKAGKAATATAEGAKVAAAKTAEASKKAWGATKAQLGKWNE